MINYENMTKEQLIAILREQSLFKDFKSDIENLKDLKESNLLFMRINEHHSQQKIGEIEYIELKHMLTKKHEELAKKQQSFLREQASLPLFEKMKKNIEPINDEEEEWRDDGLLYCKKCNTPRSFILKEHNFASRTMCDCQQKEKKISDENERIEKQKQFYLKKLRDIGIVPDRYGLENWIAKDYYQKFMLEKVKEFLKEPEKSIIITGLSGAGKTYLLSSAVVDLINRGFSVDYLKWLEKGKYLKSIINDPETYQKEIQKYKNAPILYIDDFLKVGKNEAPTSADISLAFEILDHRKENNLPTMISSERSLPEILTFDEAIGGRIMEICKIRVELKEFDNVQNFRLKL